MKIQSIQSYNTINKGKSKSNYTNSPITKNETSPSFCGFSHYWMNTDDLPNFGRKAKVKVQKEALNILGRNMPELRDLAEYFHKFDKNALYELKQNSKIQAEGEGAYKKLLSAIQEVKSNRTNMENNLLMIENKQGTLSKREMQLQDEIPQKLEKLDNKANSVWSTFDL